MYNRFNKRINYFNYLNRSAFQSDSSPYFFGHGRTALKVGLLTYNTTIGKKVLVPNYIGDSCIDPFNELGMDIIYYTVNSDLSPDWDTINRSISKDVIAIMMVHYFGIPQAIEQFQSFAKEHNLLLIEDNSHGHGGIVSGKLLGTFGDIGFTSPRKSFPILNGGVLFLKTKNISSTINFPIEQVNIPKLIIRDITGRILDNCTPIKELFLPKRFKGVEWDPHGEDWSIDKTSFDTLMKYNLQEVRELRTSIYNVWWKWSKSNNLVPIFSLNDDSFAPLSLPLIFDSTVERDKWLRIFSKNHIAVYRWPYLPKEIEDTGNSGKDLFDKTLYLPIHLSMKAQALEEFLLHKFLF